MVLAGLRRPYFTFSPNSCEADGKNSVAGLVKPSPSSNRPPVAFDRLEKAVESPAVPVGVSARSPGLVPSAKSTPLYVLIRFGLRELPRLLPGSGKRGFPAPAAFFLAAPGSPASKSKSDGRSELN